MAKRRKVKRHTRHSHAAKELSDDQEFQLMAMILDKFLWLGTGLIGIGLFFMLYNTDVYSGVPYAAAGLGIMIVFGLTIIRYFENYSS